MAFRVEKISLKEGANCSPLSIRLLAASNRLACNVSLAFAMYSLAADSLNPTKSCCMELSSLARLSSSPMLASICDFQMASSSLGAAMSSSILALSAATISWIALVLSSPDKCASLIWVNSLPSCKALSNSPYSLASASASAREPVLARACPILSLTPFAIGRSSALFCSNCARRITSPLILL